MAFNGLQFDRMVLTYKLYSPDRMVLTYKLYSPDRMVLTYKIYSPDRMVLTYKIYSPDRMVLTYKVYSPDRMVLTYKIYSPDRMVLTYKIYSPDRMVLTYKLYSPDRMVLTYKIYSPDRMVLTYNIYSPDRMHPLTCLGSFNREEEGWRKDRDWVWRRDGEEDEEILWMIGEEEKKRGNSFLVNLEERTGGGVFTCHSLDRTLLKNTTVLVKHLDEQKRILEGSTRTGYMKCSTRNFQGEFHCSWKYTTTYVGTVMSVRVARDQSDAEDVSCSVDASGQQWTCLSSSGQSDIMCSVNSMGLGVFCVDRQYCPYAEETDRITLTIYMRTNYLLEEYSQHFYLSEIEIEGRERKNGCTCDSPCTESKDALCDTTWSDWTEYRSVPHSILYSGEPLIKDPQPFHVFELFNSSSNKGNKRGKQEKQKKQKKKQKKSVSQ
ncbi:unnamed protein product [Coregonus sp. 'balchen']|nr:unnamed protein product [Coregonus sp. 'balchen']